MRITLRTLWRNPGFAIAAILTRALGIGANTAVFGMIYHVLLKPLPFPEPDRLVRLTGGATVARFEALEKAESYTGTAASMVFTENVTLVGADTPEMLRGVRVSAKFFDVLGVTPRFGRGLVAGDTDVAIISAELWTRRFGGDPGVIGSTATIAKTPHTIIGVLPAGFEYPMKELDVWRPFRPEMMPEQSRRNTPALAVIGRLKPAATIESASAELSVINRRYAAANPGKLDAKPKQLAERVAPLKASLVRDTQPMLWMLFGAVGLLLLIACANAANLLLARAASRSKEFAIRAALGAGRGRLIRQLLAESLVLACAGGALGLLFAFWSVGGIVLLPGLELPRMAEIGIGGPVLGFSLLLTLATTLLFGLAPAITATRPGEVSRAGWFRPRGLLVVGQVALSVVLLTGALLLIESLAALSRVNPGFDSANLLTMRITLPRARHEEFARRVESIPGVRAAGVTLTLPTTGWAGTPVHPNREPLPKLNERPIAILQNVTPGYFRAMAIPLKRGRLFDTRDAQSAPLVAVINESLTRRFWPDGEDPIGQFVLAGASPAPLEVIGVVGDVRQSGLGESAELGLYRPRAQMPEMTAMFAVRTDGDPRGYVNAIRRELMSLDKNEAISAVKTMDAVMGESEARRRSVLILLGLFASSGLLLAVVGIYGVVAYSVVQRTRELGIRQALGASPADVVMLVVRHGLGMAVIGAALGIGGSFALTRFLKGLLYGVSETEPVTFAGAAAVLVLVALAASYVPARRAARIDPMRAISDAAR